MKKIIIANWKMQLSYADSLWFAKKLGQTYRPGQRLVVICPEYPALPALAKILQKSKIFLGAQDSATTSQGAYTGEVSPSNLKALGVKYVILGHSERREHLHENSAIINGKVKAALQAKLIPILCVGEKLAEKKAGRTREVLAEELRRALKGVRLRTAGDLIVAYEPVWAIGNGHSFDPEAAAEIQAFISQQVKRILKKKVAIIYGGSVNSQNAAAFLKQPAINGLLVGTASWTYNEFQKIIRL